MNGRVRRAAVWLAGVIFCLLAFYLALTRSFEFAVAAYVRELLHRLPAPAASTVTAALGHFPVDEDPAAWIVRKAASIGFFGAVGMLARIVAGRRFAAPAGRACLVIAAAVAMSAAIEIDEWPERIGDIAFDLACGATGGLLGVLALRMLRRL